MPDTKLSTRVSSLNSTQGENSKGKGVLKLNTNGMSSILI